ncbi:MAG: biotin transporter BioY [Oscillospiraceae bacterium]|nr:biotin transporter BioY [Oscillospiraceae bacterium]
MKAKKIVVPALLAAVVCVLAPWSLPVGPIPVSLASFAVYLAAAVGGRRDGTIAVGIYILLGAVGLPVFAGFAGGAGVLAGVTGGYIVGYLPCAFLTGLLIDRFEDKRWVWPAAMLLGTAALYALGTAWFIIETHSTLAYAASVCMLPFLLGDALKIAAASLLGQPIRRRVRGAANAGR